MSIIDSFSLEYRFTRRGKKRASIYSRYKGDKALENKSSNINSINNNLSQLARNKTTLSGKIISVDLLDQLTSLGYKIDSIMSLAKQNKFTTVEEALDLLERDPETKLYNHYFCPYMYQTMNSKCRICGNSINEHINEEDSGNKLLNQTNDQFNSIKENQNIIGEEEKIIDGNKYDSKIQSNNNSLNNQSPIVNGTSQIINGGFPNNNKNNNNKSSFSPEYKSKRLFKINANKGSNNYANNNSSLLLLNHFNENEKKPIFDKLNINNNDDNINNIINNNNNKKIREVMQASTINNISINIKEDLTNLKQGDSVNLNRPIFIKINTINSGRRKSKALKELENINNEKQSQSHTHTVPIKKSVNSRSEFNEIISVNDCDTIAQNNINNTHESQDSRVKLNNSKLPKYCKVNIPKETLKLFDNPKMCPICFNGEINKNNIAQEHCQHKFCDKCINTYITGKIVNGEVLEIKCIMAGCTHKYSQEEIKMNVSREIFVKYKNFYRIQKKLKNPDKKYINCPFVDCEELVDCTNITEGNVSCDKGHIFCRKCFKIGGHQNMKCAKDELNLTFFKELKKNNSRGVSVRYKQCPECQILIEKIDGCNQMKCLNCGFTFCWLCLKEYTPNHFSMYNINGCPGMRFETEKTYKIRNNPCLNCIWHLLSCLLGIGMFILIYFFYMFCGCSYEFVKCYQNRREQNDSESDFSVNDYFDERSANVHNRKSYLSIDRSRNGSNIYNTNNIVRVNKNQLKKEKKDNKYIIALLIFLGILCQPIYLTFYILYALIECYKRLNCLFYFPD